MVISLAITIGFASGVCMTILHIRARAHRERDAAIRDWIKRNSENGSI